MGKKIMAVIDREEEYAVRLMGIFNSKNRMGFQAEMFTTAEAFQQYAEKCPVEILLAGDTVVTKELEKLASLTVIISEGTKRAGWEQARSVYKYQSSEQIIQKVMEYYAAGGGQAQALYKPAMKVYGIYAPQGRRAKSRFSWNLARWLGKKKSVLYLNLTAFMGLPKLYEGEKDLADIMYYVRHGFDNLIYLACSMAVAVEGVDCMPCMKAAEDLLHVPADDWMCLLRIICEQSSYEAVVLDLEECIQQFYRLLEACSEVYFPFAAGNRDESVWKLCNQYFVKMGAEETWKKGKKLELDQNCWRTDMESIISI